MQREKNAEKVNPSCVPPLLQLALQLVEEDRGAGGDVCAYSTLNIDPQAPGCPAQLLPVA